MSLTSDSPCLLSVVCAWASRAAPSPGLSEKKVIKVRMTVIMEPESVFAPWLVTHSGKQRKKLCKNPTHTSPPGSPSIKQRPGQSLYHKYFQGAGSVFQLCGICYPISITCCERFERARHWTNNPCTVILWWVGAVHEASTLTSSGNKGKSPTLIL